MATQRRRTKVVVNKQKITQIQRADDKAMAACGQAVLDTARVPDEPPLGQGLIETGRYTVLRGGKAVASGGVGADKVPRSVQAGDGATLVCGYGFPGRFLEFGTIKMRARPFLTPAYHEVMETERRDQIFKQAMREARV